MPRTYRPANSINQADELYQASVNRALADLIAFRRQIGASEDPYAVTITVDPVAVLRMQIEEAQRGAH